MSEPTNALDWYERQLHQFNAKHDRSPTVLQLLAWVEEARRMFPVSIVELAADQPPAADAPASRDAAMPEIPVVEIRVDELLLTVLRERGQMVFYAMQADGRVYQVGMSHAPSPAPAGEATVTEPEVKDWPDEPGEWQYFFPVLEKWCGPLFTDGRETDAEGRLVLEERPSRGKHVSSRFALELHPSAVRWIDSRRWRRVASPAGEVERVKAKAAFNYERWQYWRKKCGRAENAHQQVMQSFEFMKADMADLQSQVAALTARAKAAEDTIATATRMLDAIVCTKSPDDGVVLLSNEGPTHYDPATKHQTYDHVHFSPLGDALIALHNTLSRYGAEVPTPPNKRDQFFWQ